MIKNELLIIVESVAFNEFQLVGEDKVSNMIELFENSISEDIEFLNFKNLGNNFEINESLELIKTIIEFSLALLTANKFYNDGKIKREEFERQINEILKKNTKLNDKQIRKILKKTKTDI